MLYEVITRIGILVDRDDEVRRLHADQMLDRGKQEVARLPLDDVFGSPSFHAMVARYADARDNFV